MNILVTGIAGFIGSQLGQHLLDRGDHVIGIDNLNDYYDINLKQARLNNLLSHPRFTFLKTDITDQNAIEKLFSSATFDTVVHLAAQAGVRYSVDHRKQYIDSNIIGFYNIIENCKLQNIKHLIFASSSSVYGRINTPPFSEQDDASCPNNLYAASKKANELIAYSYAYLYQLPCTGIRYFSVYGPWGRPDMALWQLTQKIHEDKPIDLFNNGETTRSFTYIDDAIDGTLRIIDHTPSPQLDIPYKIYNIGNPAKTKLLDLVEMIEVILNKTTVKNFFPEQRADVLNNSADISLIKNELGFTPTVDLQAGVQKFIDWYLTYTKSL